MIPGDRLDHLLRRAAERAVAMPEGPDTAEEIAEREAITDGLMAMQFATEAWTS